MEHRKDARFPVQFRSSFSSTNVVSGEGTLSDLSIRGCRIFTLIEVKPGTALLIKVQTSQGESPIQISQAIVRWFRGSHFGCEFVNLNSDEWARLHQVVKDLEMEPYKKAQEDPEVG